MNNELMQMVEAEWRDRYASAKREVEYWQEMYQALQNSITKTASMRIDPQPMMLTDAQSYELGRMKGAQEEREACAKVCDELASGFYRDAYDASDGRYDWKAESAEECADDIRARSQQ